MIIAFEGLDGAGKETQSKWLADSLHQEGLNVSIYHFPAYKGPFYEIYNKIVGMDIPIDGKNRLIQHLFTEDMKRVIPKASKNQDSDTVIICDRYFYSTLVYGQALGVDKDTLSEYAKDLPKADLVFYLRLDPEDSRVTGHFAYDIQNSAADRYDNYARYYGWVNINATDSMRSIASKCIRETKAYREKNF